MRGALKSFSTTELFLLAHLYKIQETHFGTPSYLLHQYFLKYINFCKNEGSETPIGF